ncbi:MAG TPA: hypothetical protein VI408_11930 [Gaiellaceae bacterium]
MRRSFAAALAVLACAGCGGPHHAAPATTVKKTPRAAPAALRVGVVGPLAVDVPGAVADRGTLAQVAHDELVLADARVVSLPAVAAAANAHPASRFAYVGGSAARERAPNLVGLVLDESAAAELAGSVAGTIAAAQGTSAPRIAWVGPEERQLAAAFARGVRTTAPDAQVLHQWSRSVPARCKQAALTAIDRGAVLVMAHGGNCALAAEAAAHDQNQPALELGDFELPSAAAATVVRDALAGVRHGGEDIVFGATTGAIGVRTIDPLVPPDVAAQARAAAQDFLTAG